MALPTPTAYFSNAVDESWDTVLNWFSDATGLVPLGRRSISSDIIAGVTSSAAQGNNGTFIGAAVIFSNALICSPATADITITAPSGIFLTQTTTLSAISFALTLVGPLVCQDTPTLFAGQNLLTLDFGGAAASTIDLTGLNANGGGSGAKVIFSNYTGVLDWTNATQYGPYITAADISFGTDSLCQINAVGCVTGSVTNNSSEARIPYSGEDINNPATINGTFTDTSNGELGGAIINGLSIITNLSGYQIGNPGNTYNGGLRFTGISTAVVPAEDENVDTYNSWIIVNFADSNVVYFTKGAPGSAGGVPLRSRGFLNRGLA